MSTSAWIAFAGSDCLAQGDPLSVTQAVKVYSEAYSTHVLVFDAVTSRPIEIDLRGTVEEVLARLGQELPTNKPVGRPKLGVVPKEVTLLPRHWEWLATQSGGASVTLRKLVEQAMKTHTNADQLRHRQESSYRFMQAVAGNEAHYEEANRALFASDWAKLAECIQTWPADVRAHVLELAQIKSPD